MHRHLAALLLGCSLMLPARAAVEVSGVGSDLRRNIEAWLSVASLPADAPESLVRRRHRRAEREIRKALQPFGYYSPSMRSDLQIVDGKWTARYEIDSGPRVQVVEARCAIVGSGAQESTITRAARAFEKLGSESLSHSRYEAAKDALLESAVRLGYLDAEFSEHEMRVDVPAAEARLLLTLDTGPQFRFGPVSLVQDELNADFLARYIDIEEGEIFDSERLLALRLRLFDLEFFDRIEIEVDREEAQDLHIPIRITATPRPRQHYKAGVGFGTDTGPRFTGASEFRRLNRRGHSLRVDFRVSEVLRGISGQYQIPAGRVAGNRWTLSGSATAEELGDTRSDQLKVGLARSLVRGPRLWRGYFNYEREVFREDGDRSVADLFTPGLSLTLRRADNSLFPRRGYRLLLDVHGAHELLLSTASFIQTRAVAKIILPLGGNLRLLGRSELGASFVDEFTELPPSQRFFAGGDQSVRGYGYQNLGPRNDEDEVIGGEYLFVGSLELDWLLLGNFGLGGFYDVGGASEVLFGDLAAGAGGGLRWRSPIGMVRVDVAHPFDDPDERFRIHIGIGADL